MKRISWLLIVPLALAVTMTAPVACVEFGTFTLSQGQGGGAGSTSSSSTGGNGGTGGAGGMTTSSSSGGGAGGMSECASPADCPTDECRTEAMCDKGQCKWTFAADLTPAISQLYGDCKDRVCDGSGNFKEIDGDTTKDAYDWGMANICYAKACNGFVKPTGNDGATCTTPWGDATGKCKSLKCIKCTLDTECGAMEICREGRCIANTCEGGVKNGTESDIDCGGANCLPCTADKECLTDSDCDWKCNVDVMPHLCIAPTCADMAQNGSETDVDCGGVQCIGENPPKACGTGKKCIFPDDCESLVCIKGLCAAPTCTDFTQNGEETGIDCGGQLCGPCPS